MADTTALDVTDTGDIPNIVAATRDAFRSGRSLDISFRKQQLEKMQKLLEENKMRIFDALKHDLSKSTVEAQLMEYNLILKDVFLFLDNLDELAAPKPHPKDLLNKLNSVYLQPEPYGVVLVIAPWNYPVQLCLLPLIGAMASGNCCVLKPSESAIATSNLMKDLIPKYLDNDCYQVVTGALDCSKVLLQERFDHIFFTGSTNVGRIVMKYAAEHITPVTLELGGKSPVLVAPDANIAVAARRIVWGKFLNAGQTCIAPDYVLCPRDKMDSLVENCKKTITEFYGEDPKESKDFGRIITAGHHKRLLGLLEKSSGTISFGGDSEATSQYLGPTLITGITTDDDLMQEEIFGPILPFVAIDDVDSAIKLINDREKPLAFYVFTESSATFDYINKRTSAGGVCHNDTLMHSAIESFPFGGVGQSGMGCYHGKCTFQTFSHYKPVLSTSTGMEILNKLRYPPYNDTKTKRLEWVLGRPGRKGKFTSKLFYLFCVVAVVAVLVQTFGLPNWLYRR